jgi:hypothetical protein
MVHFEDGKYLVVSGIDLQDEEDKYFEHRIDMTDVITSVCIKNDAVTTEKLNANAVTTEKLAYHYNENTNILTIGEMS